MIRPEPEDPTELVEMKVKVPRSIKESLVALKRLRGVTHSEITQEALEAHLDELRVTGRDV